MVFLFTILLVSTKINNTNDIIKKMRLIVRLEAIFPHSNNKRSSDIMMMMMMKIEKKMEKMMIKRKKQTIETILLRYLYQVCQQMGHRGFQVQKRKQRQTRKKRHSEVKTIVLKPIHPFLVQDLIPLISIQCVMILFSFLVNIVRQVSKVF